MITDPLWAELCRGVPRIPRYELHHGGRCPICRCGAARIEVVLTVWWSTCWPCGTRWPIGVNAFDSERVDVDKDGVSGSMSAAQWAPFESAYLLAQMTELADLIQFPDEGLQMKPVNSQSTSAPAFKLYDLPGGERLLRNLAPPAYKIVTEAALQIVVERHVAGQATTPIAAALYKRIRGVVLPDGHMTVAAALDKIFANNITLVEVINVVAAEVDRQRARDAVAGALIGQRQ